MDRRKELKEQYRQMKPDMGAFIIRSRCHPVGYLEVTQDLKSTINSTVFKLNFGNHPNKRLQTQWKHDGEAGFTVEILEILDYDQDEGKTDYSEELALLKLIWEEKLSKENLTLY
ncbi:MAG: GIY-YIG nuclease family protein [Limnochordia bacterium]|nr:GIY-YIG nuclease family protein [Limnochordia bacterium]